MSLPQTAIIQQAPSPPPVAVAQTAAAAGAPSHEGFTFHDFINIINPLQHIPVVGTIYREITGDTLKPISNILGGALFGGVIGFATSAVDSIVQEVTGEDIGAHVMATLGLHHDHAKTGINVATPAKASPQIVGKPVPQMLITEAAADRAAQAKKGALPGQSTAAPQPNGAPAQIVNQPTDFWRSLQRGGAGVQHSKTGTNPPPTRLTPGDGQPGIVRPSAAAGAQISQANPANIVPNAAQPAASPGAAPQPNANAAWLATQAIAAAPASAPASGPDPMAAMPDLRKLAGQPQPAQLQAAAPAVPSPTAAPVAQPGTVTGPGGAGSLPRDQIPQMMMQALAKYQAMQQSTGTQASGN